MINRMMIRTSVSRPPPMYICVLHPPYASGTTVEAAASLARIEAPEGM
jgi:hypothetical protein